MDPIADFLTRVRNGIKARHRVVEVPASNMKRESQKFYLTKVISCRISSRIWHPRVLLKSL